MSAGPQGEGPVVCHALASEGSRRRTTEAHRAPRLVFLGLEALPDQESPDLRQSYAWTVSQLATLYGSRSIDQSFHDIRAMLEDALRRGGGAACSAQLRWLWDESAIARRRAAERPSSNAAWGVPDRPRGVGLGARSSRDAIRAPQLS